MATCRTFHANADRTIAPLGVEIPYWILTAAVFFTFCFFIKIGVWGPLLSLVVFFGARAVSAASQKRHMTQVLHYVFGWSLNPDVLPSVRKVRRYGN